MALTPEAKVKRDVKRLLDKYKVWHFSPSMNGFGRAGVPDIICCVKGKFLAIECKAGSNGCTALQERELDAIVLHGGIAYVIREKDLDSLEAKLQWLTTAK